LSSCVSKPYISLEKNNYLSLNNWSKDKHAEALSAFTKSCNTGVNKLSTAQIFANIPKDVIKREWKNTCQLAKKTKNPQKFFEDNFTPYLVKDKKGEKGLFTGYYEVELEGSIVKTNKHKHPIYLHSKKVNTKIARSVIEKGALRGKKLEVAYVSDKVGLFFMHIQGCGKIKIGPQSYIKLGYAEQNGHPYFAIGNYLTKNNLIDKNTASAESIIKWLNGNPHKAAKIMNLNESYVFFRVRDEHHPVGAMGVEVTPMRTLAVDRKFIPLGLPLWLETTYPREKKNQAFKPFNRIMVAQDVGGAIKGAIRGDVFFGSSKQAERYAWYMKNMGRYFILVPNNIARHLQ
jgi:membrane-bound lytic murein transglycosylase A